jgi:uncharacterized membrane protein
MKALARLQPAQGVVAMQAINVAVVTPAFMAALFGTAVACGVLAVWALFAWDERFAPYLLVGSLLYLVGTILPTIAYHVPRNDALARVEPHSADAESHWARYLSGWTAWNHVRAAAAMAAAATLTIALHIG